MNLKILGAVLVIAGCGGFGFSVAAVHKREEGCLRALVRVLDLMECELQYRMTPLPQLCKIAAADSAGVIRKFFLKLAAELEAQISPDAASCASAALSSVRDVPTETKHVLRELGQSLGRFDLNGQLTGIAAVRNTCRSKLQQFEKNKEVRLRSYQTLGLCAGAALAILFI